MVSIVEVVRFYLTAVIRRDADTGFSEMIVEGQGPRYHYWQKESPAEAFKSFVTLPNRGIEREYLPDFSGVRRYTMLPTSTGLDAMSFEDQVRFIYSVNSFWGTSFRPMGRDDAVVTLVHSALDNREHTLDDSYGEEAIQRAQELFLHPETFSPEALSELRRVADKYRIFEKYREYEYFLELAGYRDKMSRCSILDSLAGADAAYWYGMTNDPFFPYETLLPKLSWPSTPYSFIIKSIWLDFAATVADWMFLWYYDVFYRNSRFDRLSNSYFTQPDMTRATTGGCGVQTTIEPMKEDPGNYVMDLDVYLLSLGGVSEYSRILGLSFFSGRLPALSEWWSFGGVLGDRSITGGAVVVLWVIFFSLIVSVVISFRSNRSVVQYAAVLELIGLCAASLFAVVGLFWYDPIGQILAFIATVISSCEFTILLAQSIRLSGRFGQPVFAAIYLIMSLAPDDAELTVEDRQEPATPTPAPTSWWLYIAGPTVRAVSSVATSLYNASEYVLSTATAVPAYLYSSVIGAPLRVYALICSWGPGVISYGVPVFGVTLLLTAAWANFDYAMKSRTAYPLYGERQGFDVIPKSNAGSDAVHEITASLTRHRHAFFSGVGDTNTTMRSMGLIDRCDDIPVRGAEAGVQYGIIIPIVVTTLLLLVFIFAALLVVFSTRIRWTDLKDAVSQYECGSEQLHVRVTPLTASSFFRMLVVFLIFELEVVILFLAFPIVSLLNPASLVAWTVFILLIQVATVLEIRSGAVRWLRSTGVIPALFSASNPYSFENVYVTVSGSTEFVATVVIVVVSILGATADADAPSSYRFTAVWLRARVRSSGVAVVCLSFVAIPLLLTMPLKEPDVFYFLASDLGLDRKLAKSILDILDSQKFLNANLAGRKVMLKPLMADLLTAEAAGKVGYWAAYAELVFAAQSDTQLNGVWTLLRYHINANLSSILDFRKSIESKTNFCFTVASKPAGGKANFERCVQASMDIMYDKSVAVAGKPPIDFTGGIPDPLRQAWYRSFDECIAAKTPASRARKCRMAAAVRSEFLFFSEAAEQKSS